MGLALTKTLSLCPCISANEIGGTGAVVAFECPRNTLGDSVTNERFYVATFRAGKNKVASS